MSDFNHTLEVADAIEPERANDPLPEDVDESNQDQPAPGYSKSVAREYFESIVVTFIMAVFGMTFITQAVKVPTGSMLNTILVEDHLLVNKFALAPHTDFLSYLLPYRDIRRGDIIVFKYPVDPSENYVKRVIGLPGDTIQIRGDRIFINGQVLPENKIYVETSDLDRDKEDLRPAGQMIPAEGATYTVYYRESDHVRDRATPDEAMLEPVDGLGFERVGHGEYAEDEPFTVPEGHYFCLGDNRDNSLDSRWWGPVPKENVIGRAMFVYWSVDRSAMETSPTERPALDLLEYTRWGRTGTLIK